MDASLPLAVGLVGGWLLDQGVGDPRRRHPVAVFGSAALRAEAVLWRDDRAAGLAYAVVCVGVPTALATLIDRRLALTGRRTARAALLAAAVWTATGGRSLGSEALGVARMVEAGDLDAARRRLPALVGRDPSGLDGAELCRAALESVAENTADAVLGPLVWGGLAGLPGVVAHRCANTLDAMVGHRSARYSRFGWASARLDDGLGWVPARVTAALAVACAPAVGGSRQQTLATWFRDGAKHPSPNAGRCEAAFAGVLGVRLGGENRYPGGRVEVRGPLGDGPAPAPADVTRAVTLSRWVGGAGAVLAALAVALRPPLRAVRPRPRSLRPLRAPAPSRRCRTRACRDGRPSVARRVAP